MSVCFKLKITYYIIDIRNLNPQLCIEVTSIYFDENQPILILTYII